MGGAGFTPLTTGAWGQGMTAHRDLPSEESPTSSSCGDTFRRTLVPRSGHESPETRLPATGSPSDRSRIGRGSYVKHAE